MKDQIKLEDSRKYWDAQASTFDEEPDHGLLDPNVRSAWKTLLANWLPESSIPILDIGCGTGSVSILMAQLGHHVTGVDLSPKMIEQARRKSRDKELDVAFQVMEASNPDFPPRRFHGIVCRHLLWALPDPVQALANWSRILKPRSRIILIEGCWNTGGGLHADGIVEMLPEGFTNIRIQDLSRKPEFWGREVEDERYAITAQLL